MLKMRRMVASCHRSSREAGTGYRGTASHPVAVNCEMSRRRHMTGEREKTGQGVKLGSHWHHVTINRGWKAAESARGVLLLPEGGGVTARHPHPQGSTTPTPTLRDIPLDCQLWAVTHARSHLTSSVTCLWWRLLVMWPLRVKPAAAAISKSL